MYYSHYFYFLAFQFNRAIRLKANSMGYSLNQPGLFGGIVRDPRNRRVKLNQGALSSVICPGRVVTHFRFAQALWWLRRLRRRYSRYSMSLGKNLVSAFEDDRLLLYPYCMNFYDTSLYPVVPRLVDNSKCMTSCVRGCAPRDEKTGTILVFLDQGYG